MKKWKVAVLMGGVSVEHAISIRSGTTVLKHLPEDRFELKAVVVQHDGSFSITEGVPEASHLAAPGSGGLRPEAALQQLREWGIDAAFLALHGPGGEDGVIQGFFQTAGIPFTCSGVESCAVAMNKFFCRVVAGWAGLLVPPGKMISRAEWGQDRTGLLSASAAEIGFPAYVKPLRQGSSLGMRRVENLDELEAAIPHAFEFDHDLLVEKEIVGREITCGVLGGGNQVLKALPPVEIKPIGRRFFDYESKYDPEKAEEICPASLSVEEESAVCEASLTIYRLLDARGMARIDFILDAQGPWFLEVNPIPGLTPESIILKEASAAGITLEALFETVVLSALDRGNGGA
jgi:D-alanine-D-alanine ligase